MTNRVKSETQSSKLTGPRKRREQKRAIETKRAILEAALREFADKGFDGASTRQISANADVNHRLIGHHFGTKEGLWRATARHVFGAFSRQLQERHANLTGVDEPVLLRLMLREFILFSARIPHLHRFMVQANRGERKRLDWLIKHHIAPGMSLELDLLKKAQDVGMLRKGDVVHLRYLFIGAATSIFTLAGEYQRISKQDPFDEKFVDAHADMVLSMFLQPTNEA